MSIILRKSTSTLGKYLAPLVKSFILTNQEQFINNPKEITPDMGAETLANTISYAVAKAVTSPPFLLSLQAGVFGVMAGPVPAPIGSLISTSLTQSIIET